ncbi:MAG: hypothetical protein KDC03_18270 [Flavobacteriales bacterium]|nr:hypothetical protein [Flavobacteriales bacterium]MCB0783270.1 hypothetical protein [Flavobacteriales bacterium]
MNSFYSIVYAGINPASGDKLAVGLFLLGADRPRFAWSKLRLSLVRDLMGGDAHRLLAQNLKALQRKAEEGRDELQDLFNGDVARKNTYELNEPYFNYLSRYSTNLLTVGPVTPIAVEASDEKFNELFRLFVDDRSAAVTSHRKDIDEAKVQLKDLIGARVNWDAELTQNDIPGLLLPTVRLDFIGRNGKAVVGEVVDFEKREYFLEADITKLDNVTHVLEQQGSLGKAFVVGDEPDAKEHPHQHKAWNALRNSKRVELVPSNELERVGRHLETQNVRPWH